MIRPSRHRLPRLLLALIAGLPAAALSAQTVPARWNRADDWALQTTPANPWADSEGNLVWSAHHRRGLISTLATNFNAAWNGWVSGGAAIYSGVAAVRAQSMTHECYYDHFWARHHLITPVAVLQNTTGQPVQLAIGGTLRLAWHGPQGVAHDTPVSVELTHFDTTNGTQTNLVDTVVNKPTPGSTPEGVTVPVEIAAFVFHPGSRLWLTVRGHNPSTFVSWVTLYDEELHYVRSVTATEVVRTATPPNPLTLLPGVTTRPLLGATWDPVLVNSPPSALVDVLAIGFAPVHVPTPFGVALCEPAAMWIAPPGAAFAVPLPTSFVFLGAQLYAQGASLSSGPLLLSNGLDLTLGDT